MFSQRTEGRLGTIMSLGNRHRGGVGGRVAGGMGYSFQQVQHRLSQAQYFLFARYLDFSRLTIIADLKGRRNERLCLRGDPSQAVHSLIAVGSPSHIRPLLDAKSLGHPFIIIRLIERKTKENSPLL